MKAQVMRRAWEIRRTSAKKMECMVSEVHFGTCLKMAWAEFKGGAVKNLKLQYQLSNGSWVDCGDPEKFISRCEENNGLDNGGNIVPSFRSVRNLTRAEVISALNAGKKLRNSPEDWYSNCRSGSSHAASQPARESIEMIKCSCGHIVPRGSVMSASMGTSCPDCYDRMSY